MSLCRLACFSFYLFIYLFFASFVVVLLDIDTGIKNKPAFLKINKAVVFVMERQEWYDTAKLPTWCLQHTSHTEGIALLFHCLIISCSNNQNGKRAAVETCAPWVHNACNKYTCKSLSILILSQPCSATSCNWWFINMFLLNTRQSCPVSYGLRGERFSHTLST